MGTFVQNDPSLSRAEFKRGQLRAAERNYVERTFGSHEWLEAEPRRWIATGHQRLVDRVEGVIGDGKEATVYQCSMSAGVGFDRAVAKVYRAQKFRAFSNANQYVDPSQIRDQRTRRAIRNKTRRGRQMAHHLWLEREWETMTRLYDAGADIPEPYAHTPNAILMQLAGDDQGPAPQLRHVRLSDEELEQAFEDLMRNVAIFLSCDRVHGDLSAYNVLWWQGRVMLIDLPQAVEASSPEARSLLERDVGNVCSHFARAGLHYDAGEIAHDLWMLWRRGRL